MGRNIRYVALMGACLAGSGCGMESSRGALVEVERLRRDVEKQNRLLQEQNQVLNAKLNRVGERLDNMETVYVPAVNASLDSLSVRQAELKADLVEAVEERLAAVSENARELRSEISEELTVYGKSISDQVRDNMGEFQSRLDDAEGFVDFVAARQDSLNRILFERVDRKFPYTPLYAGQAPQTSNGVGF